MVDHAAHRVGISENDFSYTLFLDLYISMLRNPSGKCRMVVLSMSMYTDMNVHWDVIMEMAPMTNHII